MFRLESFHMYGVIGSAVITGIISILILKKFAVKTIHREKINLYPKKFNKGQIYGGLIFGFGWALTGACPGPLFALIGTGALSNNNYSIKCHCRNMGIWYIKRKTATLTILYGNFNKINSYIQFIIFIIALFSAGLPSCITNSDKELLNDSISPALWYGWNKYQIKPEDSLVRLGLNLIDSTSYYFGPKGKDSRYHQWYELSKLPYAGRHCSLGK